MYQKKESTQEDLSLDSAVESQAYRTPRSEIPDYEKMNAFERSEFENQSLEEYHKRQEDGSVVNMFLVASKTGGILEAEVKGVHVEDSDAFLVCYHGPVAVYIPFLETFECLPKALLDPNTPELLVRRRQFLLKSIGIKIPFIVTSFSTDPDGGTITYGSRISALQRIRSRYFGKNAKRPVRKGDVLDAQVLNVGPNALWLNVKGMDVRVRNRLMTHRWLSDMQLAYAPGDIVKVQVTELHEDPVNGEIQLAVSSRPVELAQARQRHSLVRPGNIYGATIVNVRFGASMRVSLWLEGIDVPGYAATTGLFNSGSFHSGDFIYVEVLGITASGYVHTKIIPHKKAGRR